jgi:cyclopropane fatty-acyl-phospholipid synthase-like methyltransferase
MNLVKSFYNFLPFNKAEDSDYVTQINKAGTPWPALTNIITNVDSILELGSGQGWLSNRIGLQYPNISVTGIDIVKENIDRSNSYATNNTKFYEEDILKTQRSADGVISIGVLHHITDNDIYNLTKLAISKSKKYAFIGLYHKQSRDYMHSYFSSITDESKKYKRFKKMTPWIKNETHRQSWYRDQLYHPCECAVSVDMFYKIAEDTGTNLVWVNANTDKELYDISINKIK